METGGSNNPITIQSDNFNIALANSYHLSIQLGITHFSYCILNTTTFTYEYFKSYPLAHLSNTTSAISNLITEDNILKEKFSSQSIAFINTPSTLIPKELYNKEEAKKIINFNTDAEGAVLTDELKNEEAFLAYIVQPEILTIISTFFPDAKQKAQESILINQYLELGNKDEKAFLYLNDSEVNISIFKKNKLFFNNSFNYNTKEDLLYYVLFCFEQLKISTEEIETIIFGDIKENNETFNLLYDYIRNITMGKRPHQFTFPKEFDSIEKHKYFGLFSQILCV